MSLPNCFMGTRPTHIIKNTTPKSSTAVERFSGAMSPQEIPVIHNIHFMALG